MSMCCLVIYPFCNFAVLDVSLAVKWGKTAVFYIYICRFITFLSYYSKTAFFDCLHESFVLTVLDHANQFLSLFPLILSV